MSLTIGKFGAQVAIATCDWCEVEKDVVLGSCWGDNSICYECAEEIVNAFRFPHASNDIFEENAAKTPPSTS